MIFHFIIFRFLYSKRCRISEDGSAAAAFGATKNQPIRERTPLFLLGYTHRNPSFPAYSKSTGNCTISPCLVKHGTGDEGLIYANHALVQCL